MQQVTIIIIVKYCNDLLIVKDCNDPNLFCGCHCEVHYGVYLDLLSRWSTYLGCLDFFNLAEIIIIIVNIQSIIPSLSYYIIYMIYIYILNIWCFPPVSWLNSSCQLPKWLRLIDANTLRSRQRQHVQGPGPSIQGTHGACHGRASGFAKGREFHIQWIDLRENLQETMVFTIKHRGFL